MKKVQLNNKLIILIYFSMALILAFWFFFLSVEVDLPVLVKDQQIQIIYQKKFSKSFYRNLKMFKVYSGDTEASAEISFIKIKNDTVYYSNEKIYPKNVERTTVRINIYEIF